MVQCIEHNTPNIAGLTLFPSLHLSLTLSSKSSVLKCTASETLRTHTRFGLYVMEAFRLRNVLYNASEAKDCDQKLTTTQRSHGLVQVKTRSIALRSVLLLSFSLSRFENSQCKYYLLNTEQL